MISMARRGSYLSLVFWVGLAAAGLYNVWPLKDRPRRGIDLVGGFYITLNVDTAEGLKSELNHKMQTLLNVLQDNDIVDPESHKVEKDSIVFSFKNNEDANKAFQSFRARRTLNMQSKHEGNNVVLSFSEQEITAIKNNARRL